MLSFPTMYLTRVFDNFFKIAIFTGVPAYAGVRSRRRPSKKYFSSKCPEMNFYQSYKSWGPCHISFAYSVMQCTPAGHFDLPPSPGRVNPISGDVYHVRWSGGGGKFTSPMNFRNITPNATKLGSVVVLHARSKKLYMGLLFPRWRHHIFAMTSSKISVFEGQQENLHNFPNFCREKFVDPSYESL